MTKSQYYFLMGRLSSCSLLEAEEKWKIKNSHKEYKNGLLKPNQTKAIIDFICDFFNVPKDSLLGSSRKMNIARARHYTLWLLDKYTAMKDYEISDVVNRDRATVHHSKKKIENLTEVDKEYTKITASLVAEFEKRFF